MGTGVEGKRCRGLVKEALETKRQVGASDPPRPPAKSPIKGVASNSTARDLQLARTFIRSAGRCAVRWDPLRSSAGYSQGVAQQLLRRHPGNVYGHLHPSVERATNCQNAEPAICLKGLSWHGYHPFVHRLLQVRKEKKPSETLLRGSQLREEAKCSGE